MPLATCSSPRPCLRPPSMASVPFNVVIEGASTDSQAPKTLNIFLAVSGGDFRSEWLNGMEPGSKAERFVLSFPATAASYPKAIDQLKERFGREDLLVQIYVRDLLTLVMKNAATGRVKVDLPLLYDELESKLRSLESLGKTQDKYGDFLTPLVESCLPEEVLVAWERSRNHQTESEDPVL
ncbi:uncharacterized protein TNCV_1790601 [Trichonephila clavipes]|nr:uncharacterized protein TNCV_1790601 [Trichonephila clavipes]